MQASAPPYNNRIVTVDEMDAALFEVDSPTELTKEPQRFLSAVIVSVLLHGVLALVVLNGRLGEQAPELPEKISVRLVSINPLTIIPEPTVETDSEAFESTVSEGRVDAQASVVEDVDSEEVQPDQVADTAASQVEEVSEASSRQSDEVFIPSIETPSVLSVQESLRALENESASRFYSYECNSLEEESGFRVCDPSKRRDQYFENSQVSKRSATYRALNPTRQLSRAERSLGVVSGQSEALASRLTEIDIPPGLSDYVLEELEAGITHNATLGNRAVQHMINSTDQSAAGAMARELLNDPWVIKKTRQRQQRQVRLPN